MQWQMFETYPPLSPSLSLHIAQPYYAKLHTPYVQRYKHNLIHRPYTMIIHCVWHITILLTVAYF